MLDKRLKLISSLPAEICELMDRLASVDIVISLHEIKVEPHTIEGKRPRRPPLFPMHGEFTQRVLAYLKENNGPRYTSEIAIQVSRAARLEIPPSERSRVTRLFGKTLGDLANRGRVRKHHSVRPGSREEGLWSLVRDEEVEVAELVRSCTVPQ